MCECMPQHTFGSQRTTHQSGFSPDTWVLPRKWAEVIRIGVKSLYLLSCLASLFIPPFLF